AFFDRPRWIAGPLAPRPHVQLRPLQSSVLHGEQVVAGSHAGAAVTDDAIGRCVLERLRERGAQFLRRLEDAVRDVGLEEMIDGAWNVTRDAIERFALAAKPFGRARIDEAPVG